MKAKRFILMLLVMLGSVTGAWAKIDKTNYTIVSNEFSEKPLYSHDKYYACNKSPANMVIKADHAIFLAQVQIYERQGYPTNINNIKIEGSNDRFAWTPIQENSLDFSDRPYEYGFPSVSVSALDKYQYFRLTFSGSSNYLEFWFLTISEDIIDGTGTSQNPYQLNKFIDLKQVAELVAAGKNTACAKLTADLDLNGMTLASIDNASFTGTIDGDGHTIKNLNNANVLFKNIGAATIKNLTIENATLSATDAYSGAIASQANGTKFQNCTVKGIISASNTNVGGLVGNANGTSFTNCIVSSDFTAVDCTTAGGLAGVATNNTTFTSCYSVGNFSVGGVNCGGLVGMASGNTQLTQCYSVPCMDEIRPTFVSTATPGHYSNLDASMLVDDSGTTNEWCTPTSAKVNGVWNIVVSTGVPVKLNSIKLWNARNTVTNYGRTWKKVKVYGSNSEDGPWGEPISDFDKLDLAINNYGYAGELEINATAAYTFYRIDVLENKGGTGDNYMQMADMKFVVTSPQSLSLPICGSTDGNCTANLCYHYGSTSSALSTSVETADIASGRLAYLLNGSVDFATTGPYYQKLGSDLYPHLNSTGDNYVYTIDEITFSNSCTHRSKDHYPSNKALSCYDNTGNVEYYRCKNSLCGAFIGADGRILLGENEAKLSMTPIVIRENEYNGCGRWSFQDEITIDNKKYYDVARVSHSGHTFCNGNRIVQYTFLDSDTDTLIIHTLQTGTSERYMTEKMKFYVNGIERTDLALTLKNEDNYHTITTIKNLKKYDLIRVEYSTYLPTNAAAWINFYIALENSHKPGGSHDIKHIPCIYYDCMTGGYRDYDACSKCGLEFEEQEEGGELISRDHEYFYLPPTSQHDFVLSEQTTEQGLLKYVCKTYKCQAYDPNHFVIKNCIDTKTLSITKNGNDYTADESSLTLSDAVAYNSPVAFNTENMVYSRTFYTNVWNPWFVPFTTTVDELAENGVTDVATIESIHNYDTDEDGVVDKTVLEVIKKKNGTVKAGVPYMVKTGDSYTYPMAFTDRVLDASTNAKTVHTETASAAYDFMGTYSGLTAGEVNAANHYSLNEEGKMVHRTLNILPQRWYMKEVGKENVYEELSPAMSRAFAIRVIGEEDETTGIRTIYPEDGQKEERLPEGIFDLNGRKLSAPQSGQINIINGKKHFVR